MLILKAPPSNPKKSLGMVTASQPNNNITDFFQEYSENHKQLPKSHIHNFRNKASSSTTLDPRHNRQVNLSAPQLK